MVISVHFLGYESRRECEIQCPNDVKVATTELMALVNKIIGFNEKVTATKCVVIEGINNCLFGLAWANLVHSLN